MTSSVDSCDDPAQFLGYGCCDHLYLLDLGKLLLDNIILKCYCSWFDILCFFSGLVPFCFLRTLLLWPCDFQLYALEVASFASYDLWNKKLWAFMRNPLPPLGLACLERSGHMLGFDQINRTVPLLIRPLLNLFVCSKTALLIKVSCWLFLSCCGLFGGGGKGAEGWIWGKSNSAAMVTSITTQALQVAMGNWITAYCCR